MYKPNKLLKVMSILFIVFGALSLLSSIYLFTITPDSAVGQILAQTGGISMAVKVISLLSSVIELAAGIIGVSGKSAQLTVAAGIAVVAMAILSWIYTIVTTGFAVTGVVGLILPLLFFWGAYQSK